MINEKRKKNNEVPQGINYLDTRLDSKSNKKKHTNYQTKEGSFH